MRRVPITLHVVIVLCTAVQLRAQTVLVDNLSELVRANTLISNPESWASQSFFADDNLYRLDSIEAFVGNSIGSPELVVELRSADVHDEIDLTPGGLLTTFVGATVSEGSPSNHEFFPLQNVSLQPSTRYWFLLGSANDGAYDWYYAQEGNYSGVGTLADYADSSDAGGNWNYHFGVSPSDPYMIRVNATLGLDSVLVSN